MIYEYSCDDCETSFECEQAMTDEPLTECPQCGGHVHRIMQVVGIIFRGPGFYSTDKESPENHEHLQSA